jgi:hypothetical protein
MRIAVTIVVAVVLAGCSTAPPPPAIAAPFVGSPVEQEEFEGTWIGELRSSDGRIAPIEFRLEPGAILLTYIDRPAKILWVRVDGLRLIGAAQSGDVYTNFDAVITGDELYGRVFERVKMTWEQRATFTAKRTRPPAG